MAISSFQHQHHLFLPLPKSKHQHQPSERHLALRLTPRLTLLLSLSLPLLHHLHPMQHLSSAMTLRSLRRATVALFYSKQMEFMAAWCENKKKKSGAKFSIWCMHQNHNDTFKIIPDSDEFDMQHSLLILNARLELFDTKS